MNRANSKETLNIFRAKKNHQKTQAENPIRALMQCESKHLFSFTFNGFLNEQSPFCIQIVLGVKQIVC